MGLADNGRLLQDVVATSDLRRDKDILAATFREAELASAPPPVQVALRPFGAVILEDLPQAPARLVRPDAVPGRLTRPRTLVPVLLAGRGVVPVRPALVGEVPAAFPPGKEEGPRTETGILPPTVAFVEPPTLLSPEEVGLGPVATVQIKTVDVAVPCEGRPALASTPPRPMETPVVPARVVEGPDEM